MSELSSGMGGGLRRTARNGCATKTGAEFRMLSNLSQAVGAGAEEFEEVEVAEDLELLADFVADVEGILQRNALRQSYEDRC